MGSEPSLGPAPAGPRVPGVATTQEQAQGRPSRPPSTGRRLGLGLGSRGGRVSSGFRAVGNTVGSGVSVREGHTGNRPRVTSGQETPLPGHTRGRGHTRLSCDLPRAHPAAGNSTARGSHTHTGTSVPRKFCGSQNQAQPRVPDSGGRVGVDKTASPEGSQVVAGVRTLSEAHRRAPSSRAAGACPGEGAGPFPGDCLEHRLHPDGLPVLRP